MKEIKYANKKGLNDCAKGTECEYYTPFFIKALSLFVFSLTFSFYESKKEDNKKTNLLLVWSTIKKRFGQHKKSCSSVYRKKG